MSDRRIDRRCWLRLCALLAMSVGLLFSACGQLGAGGPQGTLTGDVVAGPTCPVENAQHPCPPKPVPDRQVSIDAPDGTVVATTTTDRQGHFSILLPPGSYVVRVAVGPGLLGMRQITPGYIMVVAGQTAYIQIQLDTGIR